MPDIGRYGASGYCSLAGLETRVDEPARWVGDPSAGGHDAKAAAALFDAWMPPAAWDRMGESDSWIPPAASDRLGEK
jgi:hypothetical protein